MVIADGTSGILVEKAIFVGLIQTVSGSKQSEN